MLFDVTTVAQWNGCFECLSTQLFAVPIYPFEAVVCRCRVMVREHRATRWAE
jgi:hypothetical protein